MKRVALVLVMSFFIVAVVLLIVAKPQTKTVSILTVAHEYSRLIASNEETVGIVIFANQKDTFLTDQTCISGVKIYDQDREMAVSIASIEMLDNQIVYNSQLYYAFRFNFKLVDLSGSTAELSFFDATLEISYINSHQLAFIVGNINLIYNDLSDSNHIDMFRMYAIINSIDGISSLAGIIIGISTRNQAPVVLTDMTIFTTNAKLDWENAMVVNQPPSPKEIVPSILQCEEYDFVVSSFASMTNDINVIDEVLIFIPIQYRGKLGYLYRFPIRISYMVGNQSYQYYIDDFLFRSFELLPEVFKDDVVEATYRY
ncbi:MAG: hypothetical protein WC088_01175 [Candidatus Izemoplasmatales bacterium]|jgi:hypothetical protein|nr:hypothetical protein [Candidatus Izemoplasmatales bacterium]MDD4596015.1 hypothetical protein [Candidatus Izemoplasmatales bacterium]